MALKFLNIMTKNITLTLKYLKCNYQGFNMGAIERAKSNKIKLNQDKIDFLLRQCQSYKQHLHDAVYPANPDILENETFVIINDESEIANLELKN